MHMALHVRGVFAEIPIYIKNHIRLSKRDSNQNKKRTNQISLYDSLNQAATGFDVPHTERYAVQSVFGSNQGSAAIEAVCILPIFIFACWVFYAMGQIYITENMIYQTVMNTAAELAEDAYLAEDVPALVETAAANICLQRYLPEDARMERYVTGGTDGLQIRQPVSVDDEGFLTLRLRYQIQIPVPFFQMLRMPVEVQVRQKAYNGYQGNSPEEEEGYVYLTDYESVYHRSRTCTHLNLSVRAIDPVSLRNRYSDLDSCAYCGDRTATVYYITDTGDCYHTSAQCSGLKRTVRRVPIVEARGYAPCSRCGQ